ncbi:hypothetical protein NLI96_g7813 [Meripilus lineatus]|uniref:G domain-containing protein n=1 Tax=Meripilus lineatus TaxID=2056292 RepID=A0AAD5YCL4_9APHY|nr:hypothetical protein NLI96_g7813 [Physisporinus lineatus]
MATSTSETPISSIPFTRDKVLLDASEIRELCPQFRILVIGKANAGKTTLLRKVCLASADVEPTIRDKEGNVIDLDGANEIPLMRKLWRRLQKKSHGASPEPTSEVIPLPIPEPTVDLIPSLDRLPQIRKDILKPSNLRGNHDIEYEITFPGSNFVFHDSEGFEAGGASEVERVKTFIRERGGNSDLKNQLHAIWICIPMDDERPVSEHSAELNFFDLGTGKIPVVAVFTKFDSMIMKCWNELDDTRFIEGSQAEAKQKAVEIFEKEYLPRVQNRNYPPKTYLLLQDMQKEDNRCPELAEKTAEALDNEALKGLFISTQMNNLDLCIKYGVKPGKKTMLKIQ